MLIKAALRRLIALPFVVIGVDMPGFACALIARGVSFSETLFGAQVEPQLVAETMLARLDSGPSPDGGALVVELPDSREPVGGALVDGRLHVATASGKLFALGAP